jgi:prepilin-type N-terminal cleavage/methylation domain-containing protein
MTMPGVLHRLRRGFTILEIVIAVSVMAVLAALTIPTITRYLDQQEIDTTASTLSSLAAGVMQFQSVVSGTPFRITQLARNITSLDTTSCSGVGNALPRTTFTVATAAKWANGGPFYNKATNPQGFPLPIGTANDTLFRTSNSSTPGFLQIRINPVRFQDAILLNDAIDGSTDVNQANRSNTTGAVQWGLPSALETVVLTYNMPVPKGC